MVSCKQLRSRVQKFPAWHTKAAPNGKCCEGYTVCLQMNGAVSKVNKKFISHLTRAQRTPSAEQLSEFLMRYQQFASHAYCGASFKMASQQEKVFCVLRFEVSGSVITVQCEFRAQFRKDAPCMGRLF